MTNIISLIPTRPEPILHAGNKDHEDAVRYFNFIDSILVKNGFETSLLTQFIANHGIKKPTEKTYLHYRRMLRINILFGLKKIHNRFCKRCKS